MSEKERERGVLPEFGRLRRKKAAIEILVGPADTDQVVLDDDVIVTAD
jgi:hypothetical protein